MIDIPVVRAGRLFGLPAQYYHLVAPACTYTHVDFEFVLGKRVTKARRVQLAQTEGDYTVIPSGLLGACNQQARLAGHNIVVVRDTIPQREVYEPQFDRLGAVDWRFNQFDAFCAIGRLGGGVFDCVTAYGKTFLIGKIAKAYVRANILVVIPGIQLGKEVHKRLSLELAPEQVGKLGGGKSMATGRRVVVTTPQSMDKIDPLWPDVVIFDEVHQAAATETANDLMRFSRAKMFGFSGTVDERTDNADKRIEAIFGGVIMEVDYRTGVEQGLITPITLRLFKVARGVQAINYNSDTDKVRYSIWQNEARNDRFIAETMAYLNAAENSAEQALLLVDKLEHGLYLQHAGMRAGVVIPVVCGKTTESREDKLERRGALNENSVVISDIDAVEEFRAAFGRGEHRIAIGTAALMTGADFPRLSFCAYTSSLTTSISNKQSGGRVMRRSPGKDSATMIDCYDVFCPAAFERTKTRIRHAREEGWGVEIVE